MTKLVLLAAIVAACDPDGGQAQHPVEAQHPAEARPPVASPATRSPADSGPPVVQATMVDAPAPQSEASDEASGKAVSAEKRWVYASFFNRVKRKVAESWHPDPVWRRVDPKGTVYGTATRYIGVRVSLSPAGEVVDIQVTVPSGVKELDDEGVRAFRRPRRLPIHPKPWS